MTEERFAEWLARPPFEFDDEKWLVGLASHPESEWLDVPSWLFSRILAVGNAYRLSYLQVIARTGASAQAADDELSAEFDAVQCEALIDELEFVRERLNDAAVDAILDRLLLLAARCTRSPTELLRFTPIEG